MNDAKAESAGPRTGDVVVSPHGSAAHIETGGELLCHTNSHTETKPFDPDEDEWPENGVCPSCRKRGELLGIVEVPTADD